MKRTLIIAITAALGMGLAAVGGYRFGGYEAAHPAAPRAAQPAEKSGERKVLYWHDPMYPQHKFDKPGRSPFMNMQLVPVYADSARTEGPGIAVSAVVAQNLGVRYAEAVVGSLEPRIEATASIGWNERSVVLMQARAAGFVEKLHVRAPLDVVARGAPLVDILFPEWAAGQEEFLLLQRQGPPELVQAARRRLVLLGMSEAEIAEVERAGAARPRLTLRAPIGGVIAELGVREGMTVATGATLFRIVDLSTVWAIVDVPEAQAGWLKPGTQVEARVPAWPGTVFKGTLGAILPELNAATRTVRARIELSNSGARLKPGMFANIAVSAGRVRESVLVASEAVIRTGERDVVIVAEGQRFVPREVQVGQEAGGRSEILKGLKAGERVVASGQFLIDSEASMKGALARLEGAAAPKGALHRGSGKVTGVDPANRGIELAHGAIPSMQWPAMEMGFVVADPAQLSGIVKGDAVEFEMLGAPDKDGNYVLQSLRKKGAP